MEEIDAMKIIAEKLEKLSDEERHRVIAWATAKYGGEKASPSVPLHSPETPAHSVKAQAAKPVSKAKSGKKAKSIIGMDKNLNLSPSGQKSASEFAGEKAPVTVMQKGVVAVYYLRDFIGLEKISVSAVYTFFKTLSWPLPADLKNTLQQAGSQGWLDTADGDDIKLTSMGENLVEHKLPPKQS